MPKQPLGIDVLTAARQRTAWAFETFPRLYVSFSGGKDSTVMLHIAAAEARSRGRRMGVLFVDLEGQYKLTIDHVQACFDAYADVIEPHWVALPIHLRNAVSAYETHWVCWDPAREADWIRRPAPMSITDPGRYPFFRHAMEFEEFVPEFGHWFGGGELTGCLVGIRSDESLNRYRTIASTTKQVIDGRQYTTWLGKALYNVYPIYDWRTEDIWTYHAVYPDHAHNSLYDLMHQAGLTPHQMRICQPYGDDQRKGLWLFHLIEPETWARVVARVNGANSGALYVQETGNMTGYRRITKPDGHTWQSFAGLLLESLPDRTQEHFRNKIAFFLKWWMDRGYMAGIPDELPHDVEAAKGGPSWRRICKALLRNDYWCKGLSFSQHKAHAYTKYLAVMKARRQKWGIPWI